MSITDIFKINEIKAARDKAQKQLAELRASLANTEKMTYVELAETIGKMKNYSAELQSRISLLEKSVTDLDTQITSRKKLILQLDEEILLQEFGFYKPKYNLENSEAYKVRLEQVQAKQEQMIKAEKAVIASKAWTVNNSQQEGERMLKDYVKLILRSFNNECDVSIGNVKFSNIEAAEKKITKAFETLNKLGVRINISITPEYLKLKIEELHIAYEYQVVKQKEKEEQKRLREQMREEAKRLKEIEEMKQKIEKEEKHFTKALELINRQLITVKTDAERKLLEQEKVSIEGKLVEVEKNKQDVLNREQNTRAGYVYIISNVGSFGENIYKIGVTRRLDPTERVDELGDASVPFDFDIHAIIFSDDAPALEYALHKTFEKRRLNLINSRREFFRVSLDEIEQVVKKNFSKPFELVRIADAAEYRQSAMIRDTQQL